MKKVIGIVSVLLLLLCGCDFGEDIARSEYRDIVELVRTAVPHRRYMNTNRDRVELLKTDAFGRRLFVYNLNDVGARALVVSQKTEEPLTFYYEDDCYITYLKKDGEVTQEEIERLKARNDWDKPLDESKMRAINYLTDQDDVQKGSTRMEVLNKIKAVINRSSREYDIVLNGLETDTQNNQVILVEVYASEEKTLEFFLVVYDHNAAKVITWEAVDSDLDIREAIIAFKEEYWRIIRN